jgi:outer membrane receptor for ferrienterochelin and colicins
VGRTIHTAAAVVLLLLAAAGPARARDADEIENEELSLGALLDVTQEVWAATRTEQKNSEAPAIVSTVTREQIALWGYRSVSEVLSHLLGFYVVDDHTSANLAVRGISGGLYAESSIVKVLIDGHSVAFHSTGGSWLGPELLPLTAIERIEIVRGPASALFGADAFLGLINIRTRSGEGLRGADAWVTVGRVGNRAATDVDVSAGLSPGDLDVLVAFRRSEQDLSGLPLPAPTPERSSETELLTTRISPELDQQSSCALARVIYRPAAGSEVGVFAYYSAIRRSQYQLVHGFRGGVLTDGRVSQSQMRAGLFWNQSLGRPLRLSVRGQVFRGGPGRGNRQEVDSEFYYVQRQFGFRGADLDVQTEWTPTAAAGRARLVTGADTLVDDESLPSRLGVAKQPIQTLPAGAVVENISVYQGNRTFLNAGAYLHAIGHVIDERLSLTGGLRYDHHNIYGGQLSERVALVAHPSPSLNAKLLYGRAFKAPSPLLLFAVPAAIGDVTGNPRLKPQHVRTVEMALDWQPAPFIQLSSDVAYSVLSDKTEFVQQGIALEARNVARAVTLSWESRLELRYRALLGAHLSFEAQQTRRRIGQEGYAGWLLGSDGGIYPNLLLHGGVFSHPESLPVRATVQASYIGRRRPSDTNILLNGRQYRLPGYLLLEAGVGSRPLDLFGRQHNQVSFSITGKNLLGSTGPVPGFSGVDYPLSPRAFFLQTSLSL